MAARSLRIRLSDIREEIAGIRDLTRDANAEVFAANWGMKRAVEHALLIIRAPGFARQGRGDVARG
jgi:uncharacterized protein with HEPN domain